MVSLLVLNPAMISIIVSNMSNESKNLTVFKSSQSIAIVSFDINVATVNWIDLFYRF